MFDMMLGSHDAAKYKEAVKHARVDRRGARQDAGKCRKDDRGRHDRHGEPGARADRRSASRQQGARRPRRRHSALHLLQPALHRKALPRLLGLVPRQPVGRRANSNGAATSCRDRQAAPCSRRRGGPAGLEVARVAAERGHRVTLVEKTRRTRRAVQAGSGTAVPRRDQPIARRLVPRQLEKLQVRVHLRTELSADDIKASAPTRSCCAPARSRRATGISARCRVSFACRASSRRMSARPTTCCRAR